MAFEDGAFPGLTGGSDKMSEGQMSQKPAAGHSDRVYDELKKDLMEGRFRLGEKLIIDKIAAELGVSHTPVREVMKHFAAAGVLDARPNRSVSVPMMLPEQFGEIAELRCALEGMAASRAIKNAEKEALHNLSLLQEKIDDARMNEDHRSVLHWNRLFHFEIVDAAKMPMLAVMVENLWMRSGPLLPLIEHRGVYAKSNKKHPHLLFIQAFKDNDPERGKRAMISDIRYGAEVILSALRDLHARVVFSQGA